MEQALSGDLDVLRRHREIWTRRPELRAVYEEWFRDLLSCVEGREPVVELGAGPGFLGEFRPGVIATDVHLSPWVDVVADGCALPFRDGSVGAVIMTDVLHHLPHPLDFLREMSRVLRPGGRVAMIEPWISPFSFLVYRYLHHEDCSLRVDVANPFGASAKRALEGNAAIPFLLVKQVGRRWDSMDLRQARAFVGIPYLATFGFKRTRPLPTFVLRAARSCEWIARPLVKLLATRACLVWEKAAV